MQRARSSIGRARAWHARGKGIVTPRVHNMKKESGLIEKAKKFATKAHAGQLLKNADAFPFTEHLRRVSALVEESSGTADEIAAAWLHDVVEDTSVTIEEIRREFGGSIAEIVEGLTDPEHFADHPNKIRKAWQAERVVDKNASVKRVKIADQTVNTQMISTDPPVGWNTEQRLEYVEGARQIATNCAGVSEKLDAIFENAHQDAVATIRKEIGK